MKKGARRWRLLMVVVSLLGSVLAVELALRIAGIEHLVMTQADQDSGYIMKPNRKWVHTREGRGDIVTNNWGFRDRQWSIAKDDDTYRIAVLGDSFVAALEVAADERFTSVLEKTLRQRGGIGGKQVEVLNFGQPGHGTAQEFQTLQHKVWQFNPDMVLLAFFTANDIRNNSAELEGEPLFPYYHWNDGELVLDLSFRDHQPSRLKKSVQWVAAYSRALQLAIHVAKLYRGRNRVGQVADDQGLSEFGFSDPQSETAIYQPPTSAAWESAWFITEKLLVAMDRACDERNIQFRVVTLTNDVQVHPQKSRRERLCSRLNVNGLSYPDDRLREWGEIHGFPSLHLAEPMGEYAARTGVYLHGFENTQWGVGHWNAQGHRLAGELIAQWLDQRE